MGVIPPSRVAAALSLRTFHFNVAELVETFLRVTPVFIQKNGVQARAASRAPMAVGDLVVYCSGRDSLFTRAVACKTYGTAWTFDLVQLALKSPSDARYMYMYLWAGDHDSLFTVL